MTPEFRSLLAKEWSERRQFFAIATGLLLLFLGYAIAYELEYQTRAFAASYQTMSQMLLMVVTVLLAMTTATGEYSQKTLKFSASLPVSLRKIAFARLLGAWGIVIGPVIIGAIIASVLLATGFFEQAEARSAIRTSNSLSFPDRDSMSPINAVGFLWKAISVSLVSALSLVTLISLLGTFCRREVTVGFVGAIVVMITYSLTLTPIMLRSAGYKTVANWIGGVLPASLATNWGYQEMDGSSYSDLELATPLWGPLAVSCLLTAILAFWFTTRYGSKLQQESTASPSRLWRWIPRGPRIVSRLKIRWPARWTALVWQNARQSIPLCIAGFVMALLMTMTSALQPTMISNFADNVMANLISSTWAVGLLWGAIVAVGIFSSELKPGLNEFWRSRPISINSWFWIKYCVGLAAVVITLDIIPYILSQAAHNDPQVGLYGMAYLACMPLLHMLVYSLAVAAVCWHKQPVLAAGISLMGFSIVEGILGSIPVYPQLSLMNVYNRLTAVGRNSDSVTSINLLSEGYPIVYGIALVIIVVSTILARRAIMKRALYTGIALACLSWSSTATAIEPKEIAKGIAEREAIIESLHLRWTHAIENVVHNSEVMNAINSEFAHLSFLPDNDNRVSELYQQSDLFAYLVYDSKGNLKSQVTFDGKLRRSFIPSKSVRHSSSIEKMLRSQIPVPIPDSFLVTNTSLSLKDLLEYREPVTISEEEIDGERIVNLEYDKLRSFFEQDNSKACRLRVSINTTRDYWPVFFEKEISNKTTGKVLSRTVTSVQGWINAGPISYPQQINVTISATTENSNSNELLLLATQRLDVEMAEVNLHIPESVFTQPFPADTVFRDNNENEWYVIDSSGQAQKYTPRPRGLIGAVLVYHLMWISAGLFALFYWRKAG